VGLWRGKRLQTRLVLTRRCKVTNSLSAPIPLATDMAKKKKRRCDYCHKEAGTRGKGRLRFAENPYSADVFDDHRKVWIHEGCMDDAAAAI